MVMRFHGMNNLETIFNVHNARTRDPCLHGHRRHTKILNVPCKYMPS